MNLTKSKNTLSYKNAIITKLHLDLKTFSKGGVFLSKNNNLLIFYPRQAGKYSFDYYRDGQWHTKNIHDLILKMVYFCYEYDLVCEL